MQCPTLGTWAPNPSANKGKQFKHKLQTKYRGVRLDLRYWPRHPYMSLWFWFWTCKVSPIQQQQTRLHLRTHTQKQASMSPAHCIPQQIQSSKHLQQKRMQFANDCISYSDRTHNSAPQKQVCSERHRHAVDSLCQQ